MVADPKFGSKGKNAKSPSKSPRSKMPASRASTAGVGKVAAALVDLDEEEDVHRPSRVLMEDDANDPHTLSNKLVDLQGSSWADDDISI